MRRADELATHRVGNNTTDLFVDTQKCDATSLDKLGYTCLGSIEARAAFWMVSIAHRVRSARHRARERKYGRQIRLAQPGGSFFKSRWGPLT